MSDIPNGKIERLKKALYSKQSPDIIERRKPILRELRSSVGDDWKHDQSLEGENDAYFENPKKRSIFFTAVLSASIVFFVAAVAFAGYMIIRGGNTVSADNVVIAVGGPVQIGGGEELSLDITVSNNNPVKLVLADLTVEYPNGTKKPAVEGTGSLVPTDLKRDQINLGDINPSSAVKKTFKAILYGEENSTQDIKIKVEYRVPGSNAIFQKEKTFSIFLSSAPVSIIVDGPEYVSSGQETEFKVTVSSNSTSPVENFLLTAEYPFGFSFDSAEPKAYSGNDVWNIGKLNPGDKKIIRIKGTLQGQDEEARVFRFNGGSGDSSDSSDISTVVITKSQTVTIKKPFIGTQIVFDDSATDNFVARSGKPVRLDISFVNNTPVTIVNPTIDLHIYGQALQKSAVYADKGFYDSVTDTVRWSSETNPTLKSLEPGERGDVTLTFSSKNITQGIASYKNPEIKLDVNVSGSTAADGSIPKSLTSNESASVKIASDFNIASQSLHSVGTFVNSGPLPPKVGQTTTYTINWIVTNGSNDITNAKVIASLPSYVTWVTGNDSSGQNISFDPVGGKVTWEIGSVAAGTGYTLPKKTASFQVSITPSVSQVGTTPTLVNETSLEGFDSFASSPIVDTAQSVSTRIFSDPQYNINIEQVGQ